MAQGLPADDEWAFGHKYTRPPVRIPPPCLVRIPPPPLVRRLPWRGNAVIVFVNVNIHAPDGIADGFGMLSSLLPDHDLLDHMRLL